jgi:Metallo-peptidase family M12
MSSRNYFQSTLISIILLAPFVPVVQADEPTVNKISPIEINLTVPAHGNVRVVLNVEKKFGNKTTSKFYQGEVHHHGRQYPAAASNINGKIKVVFHGKATGSRKSRRRLYSIKIDETTGTTKVASIPQSAMPEKACPVHERSKNIPHVASTAAEPVTKIVSISTYADPEFAFYKGSSTNDEIASYINTAEALYERQLGIRFRISEQFIFDSSTPEVVPGEILGVFRERIGKRSTNVQYIFTGKDMTGTTVGIAYVGSVCYDSNYAQGVVQLYGDLTPNIFAHELGHTLGSPHDTASPGSIMYPTISFGDPYFSAKSLDDISKFLSVYGSCLSSEQLPPSLNQAKLTITRSAKSRIVVSLKSQYETPIPNKMIRIQARGRTFYVKTNASGQGSLTVRSWSGKLVWVYAESVDNSNVYAYKFLRIT